MNSDLEIAQKSKILPITEIAEKFCIDSKFLELYGNYKAKVSNDILDSIKDNRTGKYINVTAITPTPFGEGKTVTTIGLSQALGKLGKKVFSCIRQPSLGPVFGIKGGAAGGGYSQVIPMEDFNLHLTGDFHAVGVAHNLLSAFIDNTLCKKNPLDINPDSITWRRVLDVSDRALRRIITGVEGKDNCISRETGFDITAASEVMAILALTSGLMDLRKRLGKIVIGYTSEKKPVTAEDLRVAGAMAVLLKNAIHPTLMQTLEHTPVFVHTGPFANIAHGNSSIIADKIALKLADYVVTESGFGADCGMEKFMNIKCRCSGLKPNCVVIVCTVRALKMHSGKFKIVAGKPLDKGILCEDIPALIEGSENLVKQIENVKYFGVPAVVAINRFATDTDKEIEMLKEIAIKAGADDVAVSEVCAKGGEGGIDLAEKIIKQCERKNNFKLLYPDEWSIKQKIEEIATKMYGAEKVEYAPLSEEKIAIYTEWGFGHLPVCMAKTHLSLSHIPSVKGRPTGFTLPIRDVRLSAGAGFVYPLCGDMQTMPGLPTIPAGTKIDIDKDGRTMGLF
ncbi:MAG: formate--tetrahydrofolate ligase [Candidatus Ratteibacteria bacterium]